MSDSTTVICTDCSRSVPGPQADLSANGWQCRACSLKHQIDVHQGADEQIGDLTIDEMEHKSTRAMMTAVLSVLLSLVCAALIASGSLSGKSRAEQRLWMLALFAIPSGIVFAGYEVVVWGRARRAIEVMRSREPR